MHLWIDAEHATEMIRAYNSYFPKLQTQNTISMKYYRKTSAYSTSTFLSFILTLITGFSIIMGKLENIYLLHFLPFNPYSNNNIH